MKIRGRKSIVVLRPAAEIDFSAGYSFKLEDNTGRVITWHNIRPRRNDETAVFELPNEIGDQQ